MYSTSKYCYLLWAAALVDISKIDFGHGDHSREGEDVLGRRL